jgi:hypothetical protein
MTTTDETIPASGRYVGGDSARIELTVRDGDGGRKDLSGASVRFVLATAPGGEIVLEKSTADAVRLTDPADGAVEIRVEAGETAGLGRPTGRRYHIEIEVTDAAGERVTVTTGTWTIFEDTISA